MNDQAEGACQAKENSLQSDGDVKCLCCLACPEALSSEWVGLVEARSLGCPKTTSVEFSLCRLLKRRNSPMEFSFMVPEKGRR